MKLFDNLFGRKIPIANWEEIKFSNKLYPKHSFTILRLKTSNGEVGTGWVDKAYKEYHYKQFCPYHISIQIDLSDPIAEKKPDLDMGTIEDFFSEELKKISVCHMVARLCSHKGMDVEIYVDNEAPVSTFLTKTQKDENRLFTFDYQTEVDPKWKKVNKLLSL